jgi:hypothetical protein
VQLGGKKRAAISMFTGKANVDLRWVHCQDHTPLAGRTRPVLPLFCLRTAPRVLQYMSKQPCSFDCFPCLTCSPCLP